MSVDGLPKVIINHQVYSKIRAYADMCRDEISALGTARMFNNNIYIDNVFLFHQTVGPTSTEIDPNDLSKFVYGCIKSGIDPSSLKFWWHSHVNMDVFWSSTDSFTISKFSKEWMISIVSNKQDKLKVRLDIFSPIRITLDDLPYTVEYDKTNNVQIKQEIDAKVHTPFFDGRRIMDMLSGDGIDYIDQRSFIPMPGDPKTVLMVDPVVPKTPIKKYNNIIHKSLFTKIWELFMGESKFSTVEINKLEPVPPSPIPTPTTPETTIPEEIKKS